MAYFVTGATGFIGSRIVPELIDAGHEVLGLARSDRGAAALARAGAQAFRGSLEDPVALAQGAVGADAVIHTAFDHNFSRFVENCEKERRVIEAIGDVLAGSNVPFLITSGVGMGAMAPGEVAVEQNVDRNNPNPRRVSEITGEAVAAKGVSVAVVRLPQVHDTERQGVISPMIEIAKARGFVAYVEEGSGRWPAAHVLDVAHLYRLALDRHQSGARYHAVAEEGVASRAIAETIGSRLNLPVRSLAADEVADYYGHFAQFAMSDMPASSAWTREALNWRPSRRGLLDDLRELNSAAVMA